MRIEIKDGHAFDLLVMDVGPEDCAAELRATCRLCRRTTHVHLDDRDVKDLHAQFSGRWPMGYFFSRGWETESGLCNECWCDVAKVAGAVN